MYPGGSDVVVMARGAVSETVIVNGCDTLEGVPAESVTVTVNDDEPTGPVGVPAISPVDVLSVNPVGSVPLDTANL